MIFEGIPFSQIYSSVRGSVRDRAIYSILNLLERKLGVTITYDARKIPFGNTGLLESLRFAEQFKKNGVITSVSPVSTPVDEPRLTVWSAICGDRRSNIVGGSAWKNDAAALTATLAEALERYIWWEESGHFVSPMRATYDTMRKRAPAIAPERFAGFSDVQREQNPDRKFSSSNVFLWTQGTSLVTGKPTYVPAQTISGLRNAEVGHDEPLIRQRTTIGLATWPTLTGARIAGSLEIIEREAYMIMWLNQITLPRISLKNLSAPGSTLEEFLHTCERYRLEVHAIQLLTDAPTHAVCVVIEDKSGSSPRFTVGLRAHQSLAQAIEKAMTEAMRARFAFRHKDEAGYTWDASRPLLDVGHYERIMYWGVPENAQKLEFLVAGEEIEVPSAIWENDNPEEYLERIVAWCRDSGFECLSVPLGTSKKNVMSWSIEMVVIPELQPTYLEERFREFGGKRWRDVPQKFGITPRAEPYADEPHPFA